MSKTKALFFLSKKNKEDESYYKIYSKKTEMATYRLICVLACTECSSSST